MSYDEILNSKQVRTLIFKEGDDWLGVAIEFNIVVSSNSVQETESLLTEAIAGYIESIQKDQALLTVLGQEYDLEYANLWRAIESGELCDFSLRASKQDVNL